MYFKYFSPHDVVREVKIFMDVPDIVQKKFAKSWPHGLCGPSKGIELCITCMYRGLFLNMRQGDPGEQFGPWVSCHIDHHHFADSLKRNNEII